MEGKLGSLLLIGEGERHYIYEVSGHGQVLVQRKEGSHAAEDFRIACDCYELWRRAGMPVRYLHVEDNHPRSFIGRDVTMLPQIFTVAWGPLDLHIDVQRPRDKDLPPGVMPVHAAEEARLLEMMSLILRAARVLREAFDAAGYSLHKVTLEVGIDVETGEMLLATSVDSARLEVEHDITQFVGNGAEMAAITNRFAELATYSDTNQLTLA